jgi:uncharacterized protein
MMRFGQITFLAACSAALLSALFPAAAQQAPSFDCGKATARIERAICKNARLAKLDAAIARAYAQAQERLGSTGAIALRDDQRIFVAARDAAQGLPSEDLGDRMQARLTFLQELVSAPAHGDGFDGLWQNAYGIITIRAGAEGRHSVQAETADPLSARWVCDTGGEASVQGGALTFTDGDIPEENTATIRIRRSGPILAVREDVKGGAVRGYCGANGFLEGSFFRTGPVRVE